MRNSILYRTVSTPLILVAMLLAIAVAAQWVGSGPFSRTIVEMFIRVMLVTGLYIFIGNSGIISFGHIGFMCIGAYATAWFTIPPMMKKYSLRGLPYFIKDHQLSFLVSALLSSLLAALFALVVGRILMRLSGIAASIATFAMLAIINTVYSNWETVTGGTSSIVGIPMYTGIWLSFAGTVIAIVAAWLYAVSSSGLALRAARDEAIAASASGVNIERERLIAFVVSAALLGLCGSLYAHFLGVVNPDAFYLGLTFVALSMLVVGGMNSLSGAVIGVVVISSIIQILRWFEKGVDLGSVTLALPNGTQEIAIGVVTVAILIFRPSGLMRNQEINWRKPPLKRNSEGA